MQGLDRLDRLIVEKIRNAKEVVITINAGTMGELNLTLKGDGPHDVAIAVQGVLSKERRNKQCRK